MWTEINGISFQAVLQTGHRMRLFFLTWAEMQAKWKEWEHSAVKMAVP